MARMYKDNDNELASMRETLDNFHLASRKLLSLPSHTQDAPQLAQQGIEVLVTLVQAKYGAVGLLDDDGELSHFLYTGINKDISEKISTLPLGKGLLGVVITENQAVRLENIGNDDRSAGFPRHHPEMTTLLAVPISHKHKVYGRIYLSDKKDGSSFSEADEQLVTTFANTFALILHDAETTIRQRQAEHLASKVIENTLEGVVVTDVNFIIQSVNPAYCKISGYEVEEVIGKYIGEFQCEKRSIDTNQIIQNTLEIAGHWQGEIWCVRKNGESFPKSASISAIKNENGYVTSYVIVCRDITIQKKLEERLTHLAHHDTLTGLPNRLLFDDRLQQKISHARRYSQNVALMFIDLDSFKLINDSMGHDAGDLLLQEVSQRLLSLVRKTDTLARLGGDEFTIILDNAGEEGAEIVAKKIFQIMAAPFILNGKEFHVGASIGIGIFPQDADNEMDLIKNADIAMYKAKEEGNAYRFYTETMTEASNRLITLEEDMHKALERDEFQLVFQPKLDFHTKKVVGVKTLLRWKHPDYGLLKPYQFIGIAEHTGLIIPIGEWILRIACKKCKEWQTKERYENLRVSVILSPRQFMSDDLLSIVTNTLLETKLRPSSLELEINEAITVNESGIVSEKISQLKELGVNIIITGIDSEEAFYGIANHYSVDTLRIRTDVNDEMAFHREITDMLISRAHGLKLRVVAECVETETQMSFLHSAKCDEVLGHYFSLPVTDSEFEKLLDEESKSGELSCYE